MTSARPPSLADAVGGPLGVAESALPAAAFVTTYTISGQDTEAALIAAIALGVIFGVARIVRGKTVQFALAGLGGLALSAYVVSQTGNAEDFFLPGLLANAALRARVPDLDPRALAAARHHRRERCGARHELAQGPGAGAPRTAARAGSGSALFSLRLAVQLPLYLADALTALGVARIAMGIPLFAVGIWLSWLILRPRVAAAQ